MSSSPVHYPPLACSCARLNQCFRRSISHPVLPSTPPSSPFSAINPFMMFNYLAISFILPHLLQSAWAADCECYRTSTGNYFTEYEFQDFRKQSGPLIVPELPDALPRDIIPTTEDYSSNPKIGAFQDGYIKSDEFTSHWSIQDWGKEPTSDFPIRMQNSRSNVYLVSADSKNSSSKLVLRTHRFDDFHSSAEVENAIRNIFHASIRIRARVYGAAGAVAGLFTFEDGQNESDIEILTRDDPTEIRYSNQPVVDNSGNEIRGSSTKLNMTTQDTVDGTQADKLKKRNTPTTQIKYDDWHTHRIDWVAGKSSWFVDGEHQLDKKYGVPTVPSYFVMNLWSDGGVWSGNMTKGESAYMEIEFVEMAFNVSGDSRGSSGRKVKRSKGRKCSKICVIDDVAVVGTPESAKGGAFKAAVDPRLLGMAVLVVSVFSL